LLYTRTDNLPDSFPTTSHVLIMLQAAQLFARKLRDDTARLIESAKKFLRMLTRLKKPLGPETPPPTSLSVKVT